MTSCSRGTSRTDISYHPTTTYQLVSSLTPPLCPTVSALIMRTSSITFMFFVFTSGYFECSCADPDIKYVGCFDPGYSINRNYHKHLLPFTLDGCVTKCRALGTRYMGAEQSDNFCYCGDDIADGSAKLKDDLCNIPCAGDGLSTSKTCGGDWLISVYILGDTVPSKSDEVGRNVTFLVGTSGGVRMISTSSADSFLTITNSTSWAYYLDYHLGRNLVYVYSNGDIYKSTLDPKTEPGSATPIHVKKVGSCEGFTVDWVHDVIYWMDCSTNCLKVMDLEGNNETTLTKVRGDKKMVKRMEVDPQIGKVFWVADGTLEWCDATGENFRTNLSEPGVYVRAITLDIDSRRLFYVGSLNGTSSLYEMPYNSNGVHGTTKHISSPQIQSVYGLNVLDEYLYWVNYLNVRDVIYKQPLNMTGQPEVVRYVNRAVWHMRILDLDLQTIYSGDPCQHTTCSHFCVHQRGLARCLCPDGLMLVDNTTCSNIPHSYQYVGCYNSQYPSSDRYSHRVENLTLESCVSHCSKKNVYYAGIDIRLGQCHCGDDLTEISLRRDDSQCSNPCPASPELTCGGDWLISVFELQNSVNEDNDHGLKIMIGTTNGAGIYDPAKPRIEMSTVANITNWGYRVNYHYQRNFAFVSSRNGLYRSPLKPVKGVSEPKIIRVTSPSCNGFAVDWETDTIYLADCRKNIIVSINLEGNNTKTVVKRPEDGANVANMEVDPYTRMLFWDAEGILESCELSGANFHTNITDPQSKLRSFTLDLTSRTVYYLSIGELEDHYTLFSMQYNKPGASPHRMVTLPQMRSVYGMGVFRGHLYWLNFGYVHDIIYKAPINVLDSSEVEVIKILKKSAWHMKLVHPELQRQPDILDYDYYHEGRQAPSIPVGKALALGVLSILLVLVLAGSLLYLGDTHWTRLQARLFPRTHADSPNNADNPPDDHVLLIT